MQLCLSQPIFAEYGEVSSRDKFARFTTFKLNSEVVLNKLREIAHFYPISGNFEVLADASDNKFLELAAVSGADFLITGNIQGFPMAEFEYTSIMTPRQLWERLASPS